MLHREQMLRVVEFDEADFSVADPDAHPDEVVLPEPPVAASRHFNVLKNTSALNGGTPIQNRPPNNRPQPVVPSRIANAPQPQTFNNNLPQQPQTPNSGFTRSGSGAGQAMRPPPDAKPMQAPQINPRTGQPLKQPSRNGPPSAPGSPTKPPISSDDDTISLPPQGAGFFSARAVKNIIPQSENQSIDGPLQPIPNNLPAFNLHAESPSIRKTPGVDHKSSKPITRDLKQVPGSSQSAIAGGGGQRPTLNVLNPQLDSTRRIGQPGSPSLQLNRAAYRPPTLKRPVDVGANGPRIPLNDLPANGTVVGDNGGDIKRQRLSG
jgi:DNA repair and recombination protein RAD52